MDNKQHQETVKHAVEAKFKGKDSLTSRAVPRYPDSPEREFKRITNSYIRLLNTRLKQHFPAIVSAYKQGQRNDSRMDDARGFERKIREEFQKIAEELEQDTGDFDLVAALEKVGSMTQNVSLKEWKRIVQNTLGIDLMSDYYKGDFYATTLRKWVDENTLKIKSIPTETLGEMQQIILEGYRTGRSVSGISKDIQDTYGTTRSKAQLLARDQVATLNAEITKQQQEDAGVTRYKWSTSKDSRVRECHAALDGKIISWDDPPEMWYKTKSRGIVYTGRRCHPGEDYCCRCCAIPVFDWQTVDLPMKET